MKKFFKNKVKGFFLLLIPLIMLFVPIVFIPYLWSTHTWWITTHVFLFISGVGVLAYIKSHIAGEFPKWLETVTDIILTFFTWLGFASFLLISLFVFFPVLYFFNLSSRTEKYAHVGMFLMAKTANFLLGLRVVKENFPKGTFVGAVNHQGSADYFIINEVVGMAISKIVAGTNLLKFPIFNLFMKIKCIFVDRADEESKKEIIKIGSSFLKKNVPVMIFFEGGRKRKSEDTPLRNIENIKKGAFFLAKRNRVPVVPIVILGSGDFKPPMKGEPLAKKWWKFQWWNSPRKIAVHYLDPVSTDDKSCEEILQCVYSAMENFIVKTAS